MLRKELLDARKGLRSVREVVSGPRSKKQRGEWELVSIQDYATLYDSIKWVVGSFNRLKRRNTLLQEVFKCKLIQVEQL